MSERIVEVEWEDTAATHGWQEGKDFPETWLIHSVGYVDRDDDAGMRLYEARSISDVSGTGHSRGRARDYGCATMIPRSAIRKVTELKATRRKR
jgi:hypothetical protein